MDPSEFPLRKFVAPEFIFGIDARTLAGRYARNFGGRKVLVVTDPGVKAAGWSGQVIASLEESGLEHVLFDGVTSNPKSEEVSAGAALYRKEGCNAIVAVGGGSPMDCAKGIGIVSANSGEIVDFEGVDRVEQSTPPADLHPDDRRLGGRCLPVRHHHRQRQAEKDRHHQQDDRAGCRPDRPGHHDLALP